MDYSYIMFSGHTFPSGVTAMLVRCISTGDTGSCLCCNFAQAASWFFPTSLQCIPDCVVNVSSPLAHGVFTELLTVAKLGTRCSIKAIFSGVGLPITNVENWLIHIFNTKPRVILRGPIYAMHTVKQAWWRHQMETFSALLVLCAGIDRFASHRPVTRSFDVFFDLRLNKMLNKQSWAWWFETPSRSLWRHCNEDTGMTYIIDLRSAQVYCVAIFLTCWHPSHFTISFLL